MGTQIPKKVPMGTRVPKWGPIWEQCLTCNVVYGGCAWFVWVLWFVMLAHLGLVGWCLVLVGCGWVLGLLVGRCHSVLPLLCPPSCLSWLSSPVTSASCTSSLSESETNQTISNKVLKCPPTSHSNYKQSSEKHLPVVIILFKTCSILSEASHLRLAELIHRGGVREDFVKTALKSVTTRRTRAHN